MASAVALRSLRGEGVVELALHPGGYVRFGDDFVLVATPRAPRGPLTVVASGLHAAPLAPGERAWIESAATLRVGPHAIPLSPAPPPPRALGAGWRAALDVLPPPPRELAAGLAALRAGDLAAAVARLAGRGEGLTPAGDDVLAGYAFITGPGSFRFAGMSPLGRAYLRCAERGELPDVVARVLAAGDAPAARRRARAVSRWGSSSGAAMLWGVASAM